MKKVDNTDYPAKKGMKRWPNYPHYGEIGWFFKDIEHYFTPGRKVLEIGPGRHPAPIRKEDHYVVETTLDERLAHLKQVCTHVYEGAGQIIVEEIEDESFDIILASHVLEHIITWREALSLWWKKIKPHGHLIVAVPLIWYFQAHGEGEGVGNPLHKEDFTMVKLLEEVIRLPLVEIELAQVRGGENRFRKFYQGEYGKRYIDYVNEIGALVVARKLKGEPKQGRSPWIHFINPRLKKVVAV